MARNVTAPSFKFWFEDKWYTEQGAETMARLGTKDDMSTMRSEYTRMRDVAQKRIKRLAKQFPESKAYQSHKEGFAKLKDLDPRDFPKAFAELAKFVKARGSTVTGQKQIKEKTIKTWQDQGLGINEKNYEQTIRILEEMRKRKVVYGSDKVVELADAILELDDQQTSDWLQHIDDLLAHSDEVAEIMEASGGSVTLDELLSMIGR